MENLKKIFDLGKSLIFRRLLNMEKAYNRRQFLGRRPSFKGQMHALIG